MRSTEDIARALHASRTFAVPVPSPHGPFGMEQLAENVARMARQVSTIGSGSSASRTPPPDRLTDARYAGPGRIHVTFVDDQSGIVKISNVGFDAKKLDLSSARASKSGNAAEICDKTGHIVHIDSAVLRACLDPTYAEQLKQAIADL